MSQLFSLTALAFFCIGLLAMFAHALKKWTLGEIKGGLMDWYIQQPRATVGAILACLSGIAGALLSGILTDYSVGSQIVAAFGIGYAADTINTQKEPT